MKKNLFFKAGAMMCAVMMFAACGDKDGPDGGDVKVTGVTLSSNSETIAPGGSVTLTATVAPSNATNKNVTWSVVPATGVVTVANGVVTGVAEGTAVVTVTTTDGNKTATCNITVQEGATPPPAGITVDGQFADWAALTAADGLAEFAIGPNAIMDDMKALKLYSDGATLNVYLEFDKNILNLGGAGGTPLHLYIDVDPDAVTGYNNSSIADNHFDFVLEESVTNWDLTDPTLIKYNPPIRQWPANAMEFTTNPTPWESATELGGGFTDGAGVVDGDVVKYEYQITREIVPTDLPATIHVLFTCSVEWNASGVLPMRGDGSGLEGDVVVPAGAPYAWNIGAAE